LNKAERYKKILEYFELNNPLAETELVYSSPYELLVSVILSAQCTDKRVNMIAPVFFKHFSSVQQLASAREEDVFELIKSCSYPNSKTRHLVDMARMIVTDFNGSVPADVIELQKLPGVGRKTANVMASVAFNQPKLAVDTHVFRVAARIGLTYRAKNPLQSELQLIKYIPTEKIPLAHHWLLLHGRYVCQARRPKCEVCGIREFCRYYETINKKTDK
jgi:endonuclease III